MADQVFEPLRRISSRVLTIPLQGVDTDQILPARFMTNAQRVDLANALFRDWRDGEAVPDARKFDRVEPESYRVLVAGSNFGAGSSREHAVWALVDYGFRVVVSDKIADIFAGNAARNGLLTIEVTPYVNDALLQADGRDAIVDLVDCTLVVPTLGLVHKFGVDPFTRLCLLGGVDPLAFLLGQRTEIASYTAISAKPPLCSVALTNA